MFNQFILENKKGISLDEFKDLNTREKPKCFFVYRSNKEALDEAELLSDYSTGYKDLFIPFSKSKELSTSDKVYYETKFDFTNYKKIVDKKFGFVKDKYIQSLTNPVFYNKKRVVSIPFVHELDPKKEEILISKIGKMVDIFIELDMEKEGRSDDYYLLSHKKDHTDIKLLYKPFSKFLFK